MEKDFFYFCITNLQTPCPDSGLGELHHDDQVRPRRDLRSGRRLPDDRVGPWQAQELQRRVQGEETYQAK